MTPNPLLRVMIVDATPERAEALVNVLRQAGHALRPAYARSTAQLERGLRTRIWDLVLLGDGVPGMTLVPTLRGLARANPDLPAVVVLESPPARAGEQAAMLIAAGARDVVCREDGGHLQQVVARELQDLLHTRTLRRLRIELREAEKRLLALLTLSREAIACVLGDRHLYANPAYLALFGIDRLTGLEGRAFTDLIVEEERPRVAAWLAGQASPHSADVPLETTGTHADGSPLPLRVRAAPTRFENRACLQINVVRTDAAAGRGTPEGVTAVRDPVTGFITRETFLPVLEGALEGVAGGAEPPALLYLEIVDYQSVRDAVGLSGWDPVVLELAAILQEQLPPEGTIARFSDSSFAVLLDPAHARGAGKLGAMLRRTLGSRLCEAGGTSVVVSMRVGEALLDREGEAPAEGLARAEAAARAAQRWNPCAAEAPPEAGGAAAEEPGETFVEEIETALDEERVELTFQPIVRLQGEPMELYEVFTRVRDRDGETIPTDALFRALNARPELSARVDRRILERALGILGKRHARGRDTHFFVKLSSGSIRDIETPLAIGKLLRRNNVPQGRLIIELSETSAVSEVKYARAFVQGLREFGCPAALEHFGTGLTSFRLLEHLPVKYLKVDASLIIGLATDAEGRAMVQSIASEARALGKLTIAECLEDAQSLHQLYQCGIDFAQGYYIQEPSQVLEFDFASVLEG